MEHAGNKNQLYSLKYVIHHIVNNMKGIPLVSPWFSDVSVTYCNGFAQSVAKQRLVNKPQQRDCFLRVPRLDRCYATQR
jgi:hypothetical protein